MAWTNGRRYICDRCGAETFCACTGEGERDGGYTRWNKFEPLPEGWKSYWIGLLCTDCNRQYAEWLANFMYGGAEDGGRDIALERWQDGHHHGG